MNAVDSLAFILVGFAVVMIALGMLWGVSALIGRIFVRYTTVSRTPTQAVPCGVESDVEKRSGGSNMLRQSLELLSAIVDRPVCGGFDFDRAGYEAFAGLKKNVFNPGSDFSHKKHATKNIHGILLSVPEGREAFVNIGKPLHSFLAIEHYFPDEILRAHGFSLDPVIAGASVFEIDASAKMKTAFAGEAVNLDVWNFGSFKSLFDRLSTIGFI